MTHAQPDPADPYDHEAQAAFVDEPAPHTGAPVQLQDPPAEPVAVASIVQILLAVGVTCGWFVADDPLISSLLTVAGAAGALYALLTARGWVKPWPRQLTLPR